MEQIVEESVLGVPHLIMILADPVHRIGNPEEMLYEAKGNFLIHGVVLCQNKCDLQHVLAVEGHPRRAIRLVEMPTGGELNTAIEDPDIAQPEESTREDIPSLRVFSVDPPVEIQHQTLKRALQEAQVRPAQFFLDVEKKQRRPGVHWRIHITEVPLVGRDLSVGMYIEIL